VKGLEISGKKKLQKKGNFANFNVRWVCVCETIKGDTPDMRWVSPGKISEYFLGILGKSQGRFFWGGIA